MDLKGKYGQLSQPQPPPTGNASHRVELPTPKTKIARPSEQQHQIQIQQQQHQRERTPTSNLVQSRSRNPSAIVIPTEKQPANPPKSAKKKFTVHPVTYDPTRSTVSLNEGQSKPPSSTTPSSNAVSSPLKTTTDKSGHQPFPSSTSSTTSTSKYFANLDSDDETANSEDNESGSEFEEQKYMQMLSQYAELSGISFSTSFLAGFEDTVFNPADKGSTLSNSLNGSNEEMDGIPVHKSRLPKDYKPNVVNPRPLMGSDGPAIPLWPSFIKGIVDAPIHDKVGSHPLEAFYVKPATTPASQAPSQQQQTPSKSSYIPTTVYESYYSLDQQQPPKQSVPPTPIQTTTATPPPPSTLQFKIPTLTFESRFECGNLAKAIRKGPAHYELHCRNDLNTAGHTQWYYFKVSGMVIRDEFTYEDIVYQFDIANFCKPKTLYSVGGLRPLMYSERAAAATDPERSALFRHSVMAKTVAGNNIDLLTVTKPVTCPEDLVYRKAIILSARVHPGETNASWMMRGLMYYLTGESKEARELRSRFVVKIVPMINPDGVIVGNYRCNLTGYDLNRQWTSTLKPSASKAIPEVLAMYTLVERSVNSREVVLFCDFHGHNRKNGIFMYGCENEPVKVKSGAGARKASDSANNSSVSGKRKSISASSNARRNTVTADKRKGLMTQTTVRVGATSS
ncbi:UNVERIFIED_CONTAM: Cytosolic carboxypeptidase 2, partial [Siphonaria sp. JEL0065]